MSSHVLKNTEELYNDLLKNKDDVVINALEAAEIWQMFRKYPANSGRLGRFEYLAFLQAALMAAIDGSSALSWIESVFKGAYVPSATAKSIVKKVLKDALKRYYKTKIKGEEPPIYEASLSVIAMQCKFYFDSMS
jgi:hypothetical protein